MSAKPTDTEIIDHMEAQLLIMSHHRASCSVGMGGNDVTARFNSRFFVSHMMTGHTIRDVVSRSIAVDKAMEMEAQS